MPIVNNPNVPSVGGAQSFVSSVTPVTAPTFDTLVNALAENLTNDMFHDDITNGSLLPNQYNPPLTVKEVIAQKINHFFTTQAGNASLLSWPDVPINGFFIEPDTNFIGALMREEFSNTSNTPTYIQRPDYLYDLQERFTTFFTNQFFSTHNSSVSANGSLQGDAAILTQTTTPPVPAPVIDANKYLADAFRALMTAAMPVITSKPPAEQGAAFVNALLNPATAVLLQKPPSNSPFVNNQSLQAVYEDFYPNSSQNDFAYDLQSFYKSYTAGGAPFDPFTATGPWFQYLLNKSAGSSFPSPIDPFAPIQGSSIDGTDSIKILVINNILALLIKIINSLQQVGIAQTQRLQYTTDYQQAYTNLQSQVPTFLSSDPGSPIGGTGTEQTQARNDLNTSFNSVLVNNIQSLRGLQDDTAKQQQSNINATNDAVNQQTDMCTTFIQQLSSLLSVILR